MSQKSSLPQDAISVSQVLMSDNLAEFKWRFNHRFDLADMIPALAR